jgi:inosose dehydratase
MRVAINPLQWEEPQSDAVLAEVRKAGFCAVQAELNGRRAEKYRELLVRHDLNPAPGYFSAPLASFPLTAEIKARAKRFAEEQAALGLMEACLADDLSVARTVAPPARHVHPPQHVTRRIVAAIKTIASIWSSVGVTACVHNHVGSYIQTEAEIDAVMRRTTAALCPDTGHLAWAGMDPLAIVQRYGARVRMIHVKDISTTVRAQGSALGWDYEATVGAGLWHEPGHGDLDLWPVVDAVRGKASWMIIEVDRSTLPPMDSARRCAGWLHARV